MKTIRNLIQACTALVLACVLLVANLSFTFDTYIEIQGVSKYDRGTSAHVALLIPGESEVHVYREGSIRLYDIDVCYAALRLPGHYCPGVGELIPLTPRYPQTDTRVMFADIDYVMSIVISMPEPQQRRHERYRLRFMAVSAPQWVSSGDSSKSYALDSRTPFSLQNAMRLGARSALSGEGLWSESNWSNPELLKDSIFLLNYFEEEKSVFMEKLLIIRPQVLFLGSMTLSFPGAIELAKIAKQELGNVFVILGGKHPVETIYLEKGEVAHHPGSPTKLILEGKIPPVFDLVVSGDGEEVVQKVGEILGSIIMDGSLPGNFSAYENDFVGIRGKFILSWLDNGQIKTYASQGNLLSYPSLPSPVSLFGANTSFPVFGRDYTAHVYSDMGKGCVFNCYFCSERSAINGPTVQTDNPAHRLYQQLYDASLQPGSGSAFVEDSILLMGLPKHLNELADLLERQPLDVVFGCQFTVDNLLNPNVQQAIQRLSKCGLVYVYTGMETANEDIATEMSKNTAHTQGWMRRNEEAIKFVTGLGLKHGVSILWGLGETQSDRLGQLSTLRALQVAHGNPVIVSPNWATQHPLFNKSQFTYSDWGTDKDSPYLPLFVELFGEASVRYGLPNAKLPAVQELQDLKSMFELLSIQNV